jgi:hypothetical protein
MLWQGLSPGPQGKPRILPLAIRLFNERFFAFKLAEVDDVARSSKLVGVN